jgi:hypothetical protein
MFRNLKKTLFPGRHYLKQLDRQLGELGKSLDALAAAQRKRAIESTARFRSHLAFLEKPAAATSAGLSPALRFAAGDLFPTLTRPDTSLEPLFALLAASGRDLLISNDESGANMGVFFAQAGATLPVLLDVIWNYHFDPGHVTWEQIAVRALLDDWPAVESRVLVTERPRDFNSFPEERQRIHQLHHQANTWQPGDFVCHFSGIPAARLPELIPLYQRRAEQKSK